MKYGELDSALLPIWTRYDSYGIIPTVTIRIRPTAARLRAKNQITVPDAALAEVGVSIGDRLLVTVEDGVIKLEPIRSSYFGALKGVWGPNATEEIRAERDRDWR